MTVVRIVGDIHGDYREYLQIIKDVPLSVQIGDYGIGFGDLPPSILNLDTIDEGRAHRFIRGNHDSPKECTERPTWIKDGQFERIDGRNIMYVGGAYSIDKEWRTPGVSWWEDEELSWSELYTMIDYYDAYKPEVMITHEVPESIIDAVIKPSFRIDEKSRTRAAFEDMFRSRHKPKVWFFGHWHKPIDVVYEDVRFICVDCNSFVDIDYENLSISEQKHWMDLYQGN